MNSTRTRLWLGVVLMVATGLSSGVQVAGAQDLNQCARLMGVEPLEGDFVLDPVGGAQDSPDVAVDAAGNFVAVWEVSNGGALRTDIQAQRYDSAGQAIGVEFQVNTTSADDQFSPSVAASPDGRFVVVFESDTVGGDIEIRARQFLANGTPVDDDFVVNALSTTSLSGSSTQPQVAIDGAARFFVVWASTQSAGTDQDQRSIQGQQIAWNGALLGGQIQINTTTDGRESDPEISMAASGRTVIAWTDVLGSPRGISARRFAAAGSPLGNDFIVDQDPLVTDSNAAVAVAPDESFLVVWESADSSGTDNDGSSIQGRRFAASGTALGDQFQVNSAISNDQDFPAATALPDGNYLALWESRDQPGDASRGVRLRFIAADGELLGSELQVNEQLGGNQDDVGIAVAPDGVAMAVYYSDTVDATTTFQVLARRFSVPVFGLFCDDFELGDTSRWE